MSVETKVTRVRGVFVGVSVGVDCDNLVYQIININILTLNPARQKVFTIRSNKYILSYYIIYM